MQKIINDLMNGKDDTWSLDTLIRYLYIKSAPYFARDLNYFMASDTEKLRQYQSGFVYDSRFIVCSTLVDNYITIFNYFNINAKKIVATDSKIPLYALIVEGENGWFYLDPLTDLFYNQYGIKPKNFGIIPQHHKGFIVSRDYPYLQKLDNEYIDFIDRKLDFKFLDEYFKKIHRLADNNYAYHFFDINKSESFLLQKRIGFINDNLINLGNVNGPFERLRLYGFAINIICNRVEKRKKIIFLDSMDNTNAKVNINFSFLSETYEYEEQFTDNQYVLQRKKVRN